MKMKDKDDQRLDDETERLIEKVHCRHPRALSNLRQRIAVLCTEARKEGWRDSLDSHKRTATGATNV